MNRANIQNNYAESLTRVLKHIDDHLESELSMDRLADIAMFSKFHFHRIFKGATGETLNSYVARRRIERAAILLKRRPDLNVTQVALQAGFNTPEHFSRSFRAKFGITAREFRASDASEPDSLKNSRIYQELSEGSFYHVYLESRQMPNPGFEVNIRALPDYQVASISETFGKDGTNLINAYQELMTWANSRNLFNPQSIRFAISRDDIEITSAQQYRMDYCLTVPPETVGEGRISIDQIRGGLYGLIHVQGDIHRVAQAWDYLYKDWLPRSKYLPKDQPAIELFLQGPETIGWETFDLEIGIPVKQFR